MHQRRCGHWSSEAVWSKVLEAIASWLSQVWQMLACSSSKGWETFCVAMSAVWQLGVTCFGISMLCRLLSFSASKIPPRPQALSELNSSLVPQASKIHEELLGLLPQEFPVLLANLGLATGYRMRLCCQFWERKYSVEFWSGAIWHDSTVTPQIITS